MEAECDSNTDNKRFHLNICTTKALFLHVLAFDARPNRLVRPASVFVKEGSELSGTNTPTTTPQRQKQHL